jgi:hypothetical protein
MTFVFISSSLRWRVAREGTESEATKGELYSFVLQPLLFCTKAFKVVIPQDSSGVNWYHWQSKNQCCLGTGFGE